MDISSLGVRHPSPLERVQVTIIERRGNYTDIDAYKTCRLDRFHISTFFYRRDAGMPPHHQMVPLRSPLVCIHEIQHGERGRHGNHSIWDSVDSRPDEVRLSPLGFTFERLGVLCPETGRHRHEQHSGGKRPGQGISVVISRPRTWHGFWPGQCHNSCLCHRNENRVHVETHHSHSTRKIRQERQVCRCHGTVASTFTNHIQRGEPCMLTVAHSVKPALPEGH